MKNQIYLISMALFFMLFLSTCNDIAIRISYRAWQTQTDLVVNISNARPNARLKVEAGNVPQKPDKSGFVTADSEGNATLTLEYRFLASTPLWCELTDDEKEQQGILVVKDFDNPDPDKVNSRPIGFRIRRLYDVPAGGCSE